MQPPRGGVLVLILSMGMAINATKLIIYSHKCKSMLTLRYLIMKTNIFTLACMMLMMLMLPACSAPSAEDVLKKHSEGKELTQKDYEVATAYAADAVAEFSEMVRADKGDPAKMMADAEELEKKYPDTGKILDLLFEAQEKNLLEKPVEEKFTKMMRDFESLMIEMRSSLLPE